MIIFMIKILMLILLTAAAVQDFRTQLVSDAVMLPFVFLGLIAAVMRGDILSACLAAALAFAVFFIPESEKLGGADLLLIAGLTACFGIVKMPGILIILCVSSLIVFGFERALKINCITKNGGIALLVPAAAVFAWGVIIFNG